MVVADADMRETARHYKAALLVEMFGVAAQAAEAGPVALAEIMPPTSNILGFGWGAKVTAGQVLEEPAVRVYVRAKAPIAALSDFDRVPPAVEDVATDVIPVGDLTAYRPTPCGVSVGHVSITAGTLGCLVRRAEDDGNHILSNNHVLADSNTASPGDPILEPGPVDGGDPNDPIAELTDFEPIDFSGAPNLIDAAIARVLTPSDVTPDLVKIGPVQHPTTLASLYQSVRKHGRTTLHTVGVVMDLSADVRVRYGTKLAQFDNQVAIVGAGGPFSDGGDSGSLIVDAVGRRPVALLFAGGGGTTFANPIDDVLTRFGANIL